MKEYFKKFFKAAGIRAVRTVAQTALSVIGTAVALKDVNWVLVVSSSVLAGLVCLLTCIATGLPEVGPEPEGDGEDGDEL